MAADLDYIPMPDNVVKLIETTWAKDIKLQVTRMVRRGERRALGPRFRARSTAPAASTNVEAAMTATAIRTAERQALFGNGARARACGRLKFSDSGFRRLTLAAALIVLILLLGVAISLFIGAWPAFPRVRAQLLLLRRLEPGRQRNSARARDLRNARHLADRHGDRRAGRPRHRRLPHRALSACRCAGRSASPSNCWPAFPRIIYGIWGSVHLRAVSAAVHPAVPHRALGNVPVIGFLFAGPPYGIGMLTAGAHARDHGSALHRVDVARRVRHRAAVLKEAAYGIGCTTWEVVGNIVIPYTRVGVIGGVMLGPWPRARRNDGGHLRHRQRARRSMRRCSRRERRSPPASPTSSPRRSALSTPRR